MRPTPPAATTSSTAAAATTDLWGGAGDDRFVLSRGDDVIHDFAAGGPEDALVIGGVFDDAADALANATESNGNTVFAYAGGTTTLFGVTLGDLSATDDFVLTFA